jgi:type IV secretion system protein VirB9
MSFTCVKKICLTGLLCGVLLPVADVAFANQMPKALGTDERMRVVSYNENDVVTVNANELTTTSLEFSESEIIQAMEGGDSIAWMINVNKYHPNVAFIKPTIANVSTNLTILTNKRSYHFRLNSDPVDNKAEPTYNVRFIYPDEMRLEALSQMAKKREEKNATVTDNKTDPTMLNWEYDYSGKCSLENVPYRAFDDGKFTYFQFAPHAETPAIFVVDANGKESLANYTMKGSYVVVHKTARQFSLRNGKDNVSCVFNENYRA